QGLIATAAAQARATTALLRPYIGDGRDIVVVEPSVLAMFRLDYRHLLNGAAKSETGHAASLQEDFERLRARSFDVAEYLWLHLQREGIDPRALFDGGGRRIFYHAHCQLKTVGAAAPTESLLRAAGFDVATSQVECCGMAGSFG